MRPIQTILVLEDLRSSFSGPLHREGIELTFDDGQTVLDVYQQWLLLMTDLGYLSQGALRREAGLLFADMVSKDVLALNNAFTELLGRVRVQDFKGFKALCKLVSNHLYHFVKEDVELVKQGDVNGAKRLIQAFAFTSRLTLKDIDLTQQCLSEYVKVEDTMSSVPDTPIIPALNKIIKRWMQSFDPTMLQAQHGPGGVAGHGRTTIQIKYKDLTSDPLLEYAFGNPDWVQSPIPSTLDRISQTIFVPKSYKTFRTISMESSTLQYKQQGVWREIDRVVKRSRYLKARIGFHEQERNQRLARSGSINRDYATIDLSAASDSVSYDLVKRLFRGTKLLRFLVATRSRRTYLPDGRVIDLKKFAPMGSALCFPVETLIFASICEYVTQGHNVRGDYSVFGDDIIVPTQCVDQTMKILELLGFSVNKEKSFYQPNIWFRESCGAEYCDGYDVTPMRVSRKYQSRERLVHLVGLIDLANSAYLRGFVALRLFYLRKLRALKFSALFAPTEVLSDNYTNYHVRRRWNANLQRIECEVSTLTTQFSEVDDEATRLRHWLESCQSRELDTSSFFEGFQSNIGRVIVRVKDRWRMKSYELPDQEFIDYFRQ